MGLQIKAQRENEIDSRALLFNSAETKKRFLNYNIPIYVVEEENGLGKLFSGALAIVNEVQPQLIVAHGYKEIILAAYVKTRTKIPFISTIHGSSENYLGIKKLKSAIYQFISLSLAKNLGSKIITPTTVLRNELSLTSDVIANVADLSIEKLDRKKFRNEFQISELDFVVAWVGRIVRIKCLDRAIRAIKILENKNLVLVVIGDGKLKKESVELVNKLELTSKVKFLGFRNDSAKLIGASDLLLLTSDSEGLPTVLAEAMTQGTPVVMSDLAGIREALSNFPNFPKKLVSPFEPEKFADALRPFIENFGNSAERASFEDIKSACSWFNPTRAALEAKKIYFEAILNGNKKPIPT